MYFISNFSPSPSFGSSRSSERLNTLSPAAQRLANSKLGIRLSSGDRALRQSYTPSPLRKNTPTPSTSRNTPISSRLTPKQKTPKTKASPLVRLPQSPRAKSSKPPVASLTDNLLNLPIKRKRATDFF